MAGTPPNTPSSPFYDAEFAARRTRKGRLMPINTLRIEHWVCDRCGTTTESPDEQGRTALEVGWLKLDLTRSLKEGPPYLFDKNNQVLCLDCVGDLRAWFTRASVAGLTAQVREKTGHIPEMTWVPHE